MGVGAVSARPPLRAAVGADFRSSPWARRLALVGVVGWLVYEWGVGNETVTPWLLANVIADTEGVRTVVAAAVVGFAFTTAQQLLAGLTALVGFSMFDRTAEAAWCRLKARFHHVPGEWSGLGLGGKAVLVFGLGTTAVALVQIMATGRTGVRRHRRAVVESAVLCGTVVAALGAAAGALAVAGREVDGLEGATNWILRVLGNPLLWLGLLVIGMVVPLLKQRGQVPVPRVEDRAPG